MQQNMPYIFISDVVTDGNFMWSDGSSVSYTNWNDNQPQDSSGVPDCGSVYTGKLSCLSVCLSVGLGVCLSVILSVCHQAQDASGAPCCKFIYLGNRSVCLSF